MRAILYLRINHVFKQGMKSVTVSVYRKWDRLVTYLLAFVPGTYTMQNCDFLKPLIQS